MPNRTTVVTAVTAGLLLLPFASPAGAVTTTSTIVAYAADTNANGILEMYKRPADGSGSPTRLFSNSQNVYLPSLSPDGTRIAYLAHNKTIDDQRVFGLYVRAIEPTTGSANFLLDLDVTASVAWSNDGTKIVASGIDWTTYTYGTYIVNADGTGEPVLVPGTDKTYSEEPSFSPSGDQVALDGIKDDQYDGIDLITLSSGKRARIAGTGGGGSDPVWSPDGQSILFQKPLSTCGVGLYRVPAGGGTPVAIRELQGRMLNAHEYSRDGSQIFFADSPWKACGTTAKSDVWVMDADGSNAAPVTQTPTLSEYGPSVAGGTPAPADTTPPDAPVFNPGGLVSAFAARFSWTAGGDATDFVVLRKDHGDPVPTSISDGTVAYHGPAHSTLVIDLSMETSYDFYVFAIDASGNVSPVSAPHSARTIPVPYMFQFSQVGTKTADTTFPVIWNRGADPLVHEVQVGERHKVSSVAWSADPDYTTWIASTTAGSQTFTGTQGHTYYFRARGLDPFGNVTRWSPTPSTAYVPLNDTWRAFQYGSSSGWVRKTDANHYLGTYVTTVTANARVTATSETDRFILLGDRCPTCGKFRVYIDGVLRWTVDPYSATTQVRQVLYGSPDLGDIKRHTITIVSVPTPGRPRVSLDGLALRR